MNTTKEKLLSKLRRPIHISYISQYLTKLPENQTLVLLNDLINEELIEESKYGKGYYVSKSK